MISYDYDALGRLVWEKPEPGHDGWTEYVHTWHAASFP